MATRSEPWKGKYWRVSPWNFKQEVTKDFVLPKQVRVHDITMRDGEQQAGIIFTVDDKIRIAEKLAELGVARIEGGMPVVTPEDKVAIKEMVKRNLGPDIYAFSRSVESDIKVVVDCGCDGIIIEIPVSKPLIQHGYGWPLERAMETAAKATRFAHEQGLKVTFFQVDASRAEEDWYFDFIETVNRDGYFDALAVVDSFGVLSPHGASYLVKKVKERVKKPLEIHFHNTFGLAVANTIAGVLAGGEMIHTTVNGIGEAAGNCCMEETVMSLLALYGIDTGLKYNKLYETSKLVSGIAGVQASRPLVGEMVNTVEVGIGAGIVRKLQLSSPDVDPTIFGGILPQTVGHPPLKVVMGRKAGAANVEIWADKLGIKLGKEEIRDVVNLVKVKAMEVRRLLTEDEFREITEKVKR